MKASLTTSMALQHVFCIWHPINFQNNEVQALIDFSSKVNTMTPTYMLKLDLTT